MNRTLVLSLSLFTLANTVTSTQAILPDLYYANITKPLEELQTGLKIAGGTLGIFGALVGMYEFRNYYAFALRTEPSFLIPTLGLPIAMIVAGTALLKSAHSDIKR